MKHEIKIRKEFADAVLRGEKPFEVRKNDRNYQKGDLVKFHVVTGGFGKFAYPIEHPLNDEVFEITYILSGWGIEVGYVAFGIKPVTKGL